MLSVRGTFAQDFVMVSLALLSLSNIFLSLRFICLLFQIIHFSENPPCFPCFIFINISNRKTGMHKNQVPYFGIFKQSGFGIPAIAHCTNNGIITFNFYYFYWYS